MPFRLATFSTATGLHAGNVYHPTAPCTTGAVDFRSTCPIPMPDCASGAWPVAAPADAPEASPGLEWRCLRIGMLGVLAQLAGPATIIRQAPAARCR